MPKINEEQLEQRKNHILECAFDVFAKKGYKETSMDDIVKSAKMSKGGIYHHFKSKEEIFFAIAKMRFELRGAALQKMDLFPTVTEFIRNYLTDVFNNIKEPDTIKMARFSFEFWSVCTHDEELSFKSEGHYRKYFQAFEKVLQKGVLNGELPKPFDMDSAIFLLISTLDGITYTAIVMGIEVPENTSKIYVDAMMKLLSTCTLPKE